MSGRNLMLPALLTAAIMGHGAAAQAEVVPWTPKGVSSDQFESYAAFDPLSRDLWFVRSRPDFSGWRILYSHCTPQGWSPPEDAPIAGDGVEADPYFADGGRTLWFISTRTTDGVRQKDLDIWRVRRDAKGRWGTPERLPEPVNSRAQEWFPRPAKDGWLYFGSGRPGGYGKTDLWRARETAAGHWKVENLGPNLNTAGDEYEPLVSPDGKRLVMMADGGVWESRRTATGWSPRVKLGPEVNVNGSEIGVSLSPSGSSMLFSRDTGPGLSGDWFLAHDSKGEAWPPTC